MDITITIPNQHLTRTREALAERLDQDVSVTDIDDLKGDLINNIVRMVRLHEKRVAERSVVQDDLGIS